MHFVKGVGTLVQLFSYAIRYDFGLHSEKLHFQLVPFLS